ncbi:unnamed protein product [Somion occarium]|uniref:DNA mismatch repair proteins mutS family domain-containing protein n=1 Tax=Somion occarium TaxID=3059160 RepID=A0ABP1CMM9_9APHY
MSRPLTSGSSRPWTGHSTNRPYTAQSRPATARPQTAVSSRHETSYIVAVLEGRSLGRDVGMAALDRDTGKVNLIQLADCPTYVKTLHQLHLHMPSLILVPDTFLSIANDSLASGGKKPATTSLLVQCILEEFESVSVEPVMRKYWNETAGLEFVNQLCIEDDERAATLIASANKYYALSAASALFKHAEYKLNTRFSPSSLRIRYVQVDGTMMIDPETARNLKLVGSMASKKSSHSLFGVLNHTYTAMAARLLRVNLLAPITSQNAIDARLDVVEPARSEDRFIEIKDALKTLIKMDFDKIIATFTVAENYDFASAKVASARVTLMLRLRSIVKNLPLVANALEGSRLQLLQIVKDMISDSRLEEIEAVNSRVYAVEANCNRLLDVARETYKVNFSDIFNLNSELSKKHELLTLVHQDTGFIFQLKFELEGNELPRGFINVVDKKRKYTFSSLDLQKRNARMKDAQDETLVLSAKVINDLIQFVVANIGALYKASEAVALLDMLWSFAHTSIMRPEFTGTLVIRGGRHPVLEGVQTAGMTVPNDVYCCDSSSFQIVQGKSTYLRQIGLLTVMAMSGCFVSAEYGSFRIHGALLTRLSNDDDMKKSLSTFASEMASSAMILGIATSDSLILIVELGHGTSPTEGVGISHAIAERLIRTKAYVFFATHFGELSTTLSRQPSVVGHVKNCGADRTDFVQKSRRSAANFGMTFQNKIVDGAPEDMEDYGLDLARLADLPQDALVESRRVADKLSELEARQHEESRTTKVAIRRKALLRLKTQLTQALDHSTLPPEELRNYVARFQKEITTVSHDTL